MRAARYVSISVRSKRTTLVTSLAARIDSRIGIADRAVTTNQAGVTGRLSAVVRRRGTVAGCDCSGQTVDGRSRNGVGNFQKFTYDDGASALEMLQTRLGQCKAWLSGEENA
jgi:hypothetical protein